MIHHFLFPRSSALVGALVFTFVGSAPAAERESAAARGVNVAGFFYETAAGRVPIVGTVGESRFTMPDGRIVTINRVRGIETEIIRLNATPVDGITRWGLTIDATPDEYFTGLMERVVDGPQQASWAPGITTAMNLRGQKVEMLVKPTTSVYAPFYLSSRGYSVTVKGDWPGVFDFCAADPQRVLVEFEGPALEMEIHRANDPASLVRAHAMAAGPAFLPPKWMYFPWRWRDEHHPRNAYYDGTPVTGPFNAEMMEDVLMMRAYGIPCGVYWIDRPWGPGPLGYDDFEIDEQRLPHFADSVRWLNEQGTQMVLWIGPFFQGKMAEQALAKGHTLAGQERPASGNNFPMVDLTNPAAKAYWQDGVAKLLKLGVAGFKLDRGEEDMPANGPFKTSDGRSIRENRNTYVALYVKAAYDVAKKFRGDDFVCMPRGAYAGSAPYGVFWGGDIGGTHEGLRASIIAVQRAAIMGYPNWGSDTCGYGRATMEHDLCARWLAFSCFTPIMEVGPTRNVGFWNLPREPAYDAELIAVWRLYARLHQRLADYAYAHAQEATRTGLPIVRPLFLADPKAPAAWKNWWTYLFGRDLVVSPVWEKDRRTQDVYLPAGDRWRDAWHPEKTYDGGRTITVAAELHQIPIFVRMGAKVALGDLNKEWAESLAIAQKPPDLAPLDAEVKTWFLQHQTRAAP